MEYTKEQVAKHNKCDDCWVHIDNKVYDLTKFMENHTGGNDPLQIAGGDATHLFYSIHPKSAKKILMSDDFIKKYYKGNLIEKEKDNNQTQHNSVFYTDLREKVDKYLETNKIPIRDSFKYKVYSIFKIVLFFICYHYVFNRKKSILLFLIPMVMLDFMIGVGIAHEAHHGGIARPKWFRWFIKKFSLITINGGWSYYWMWDHNVLHHGYTNEKKDTNKFYSEYIRLSKYFPKMEMHKLQHVFSWFGYMVGLIKAKFLLDGWELTYTSSSIVEKITHIIFKSLWYFLFWIYPIMKFGIEKIWICILYQLLCGLYYDTLFVINHNQKENEYPEYETNDFCKKQIIHSSNYSSGSHIVNLLTGGLNHQIEHHVFPSYSHHTYPYIHNVIKEVCSEKNIPYNSYKNVFKAITSHYDYLKYMGS